MNYPHLALNGPRTVGALLDGDPVWVLNRYAWNTLVLLAYGYLIVGIRMERHCEQDGSFRRCISMEHLNYACRVEDFFFCVVSFALWIMRMRIAFARCGSTGGVALPTLCILGSMACLEHYRMSDVAYYVILFSAWVNLAQRVTYDECFPSRR